ncbi:N-alpha-acetyltransferase 20-like [Zophobas morio]|uniref:N-alpha-acetyltransferase 20-like n=1 Tax=Zophobas morio TaxID=2755281 RepID=UPI00308368E6
MTSYRRMVCDDLFKFNNINLDPLTETFNIGFYLQYLVAWPNLSVVAEAPDGKLMGYVIGKVEGTSTDFHGHVTALAVAPEYRRLGLGESLMHILEDSSERVDAYFVDLFVRVSNVVAINMYKKLCYVVYQRVLDYYSGISPEDAFDMRKALPRDKEKKSEIPRGRDVYPYELQHF